MYVTLADASPETRRSELVASGVQRTWIATKQYGRSFAAEVSELTIAPSTTYSLASNDGSERICVLLSGPAELLTTGRAQPIDEGAVIHSTFGGSFTIRTSQSTTRLLILAETAPESAPSGGRPPKVVAGGPSVECFSLYDVKDEVLHQPAAGFFNMGTRMLLNADKHGYRSFIFGQSSFAADTGVHALHRHPAADELFYVWEGLGAHLDTDGKEHPMRAGDAVFVPRNEWHGFRNTGDRPVRAFFCLIGAGTMQKAGNEVFHNGAALDAVSQSTREASAPSWMTNPETDQHEGPAKTAPTPPSGSSATDPT